MIQEVESKQGREKKVSRDERTQFFLIALTQCAYSRRAKWGGEGLVTRCQKHASHERRVISEVSGLEGVSPFLRLEDPNGVLHLLGAPLGSPSHGPRAGKEVNKRSL